MKKETKVSTTTSNSGNLVNTNSSQHENVSSLSTKVNATIGVIEELQAYIGVIKAAFFSSSQSPIKQGTFSNKMFVAARLTQIQESLLEIIISLSTTKKNIKYANSRFSEEKVIELQKHMETFPEKKEMNDSYISGSSQVEASLIFAKAICKRAQRQLSACFFPEQSCMNYLIQLEKFLFLLATQNNI